MVSARLRLAGAGAASRIGFAVGAGGVATSLVAGVIFAWLESGAAPPLMRHPLDPAREALVEGESGRFVEEHRMFAAIQPRDAEAQLRLAGALARHGDRPEAIRVLERVLALGPVPPAVHARLAVLYWNSARVDEARVQARRAVELGAPVPPELLVRLGLADG